MGKKSLPRQLSDLEAKAHARALRTSPRKLDLVVQTIRGCDVNRALADLTFSKRRVAKEVKKVLQSAIANAENNHHLDVDRLYIKEVTVGKSFSLKRWRPRARGRVGRIRKPFSNLTVVVREHTESV
jgi:large subunit ribosomal protein L22